MARKKIKIEVPIEPGPEAPTTWHSVLSPPLQEEPAPEIMRPDSFGGEDTPHAPAAATIREEMAQEIKKAGRSPVKNERMKASRGR